MDQATTRRGMHEGTPLAQLTMDATDGHPLLRAAADRDRAARAEKSIGRVEADAMSLGLPVMAPVMSPMSAAAIKS